ncbi:MAG: NinG protein [Hyphomicrobiales bacterium]|nr:MAG: NinG protein [Hyphomicrobiales bacterium]
MPVRPMQKVCSPNCAHRKVEADKKAERVETRERKEAVKRTRDLLAEAQVAFNAFIRARDAGLSCICCGKPFEPEKPGGAVDAGHFRSRGAAPQLRFDEDNVFAQRKNCNRPGGTTYAAFRAGVVARIGEARVQALESNDQVIKWDRETLRQIKTIYRAKARALKKEQQ